MSTPRWVHTRTDDTLTVHRPNRARLDVTATTTLSGKLQPTRLAHAIRQDLWRAAQSTRGFSPVVIIKPAADKSIITAGGQIDGPVPPGLSLTLQTLLNDPAKRHRWQNWSRND